jgi:hypothetical protein
MSGHFRVIDNEEPSASESGKPIRIGIVGAAASGIILTAHVVDGLKKLNLSQDVELVLLDPKGVNPGPAYRFEGEHSILNQPAGKDMNPFPKPLEGQIPYLSWLQDNFPERRFHDQSFTPRSHFGQYLMDVWDRTQQEADETLRIKLRVRETQVTNIVGVEEQGKARYLTDCCGDDQVFDGIALATGHNYQRKLERPHHRYVPAYADITFESKLAKLAFESTPKTVTTIIGSGGSMSDVVGTLVKGGYRGAFRVISPYGQTGWPYDSKAPEPNQHAMKQLDGEINRRLSNWSRKESPADFIRSLLKYGEQKNIAPQYVIVTAMKNHKFRNDKERLRAIRTFYGNPLSPERYQLIKLLEVEGRIAYDCARTERLEAGKDSIRLKIAGRSKSEPVDGTVIDCACVLRGIHDLDGNVAHPLVDSMVKGRLVRIRDDSGALSQDNFADPSSMWAVGPLTNPDKNGIETFGKGPQGYGEIARSIVAYVASRLDYAPAPRLPAPANDLREGARASLA